MFTQWLRNHLSLFALVGIKCEKKSVWKKDLDLCNLFQSHWSRNLDVKLEFVSFTAENKFKVSRNFREYLKDKSNFRCYFTQNIERAMWRLSAIFRHNLIAMQQYLSACINPVKQLVHWTKITCNFGINFRFVWRMQFIWVQFLCSVQAKKLRTLVK